jgi:hypothetical protein
MLTQQPVCTLVEVMKHHMIIEGKRFGMDVYDRGIGSKMLRIKPV